jgi:cytochrome c554/c'-like protein
MEPFRSYEHLLRLAAVFAIGAALFLGLRWLLVPSDYGRFGAYRAGALQANEARPIVYAGQLACLDCHADVADVRKTNAHARIGCESCHGPLAAHAADPAHAPLRLDPRATCAVCHVPNAAKPPGFKTVTFAEHAEPGSCTTCHPAHAPKL